ncbi:hypothetical protein ABGV42_01790 [Paenibacillus pabuli]|uniref:hypothetical protein n=1 Tax=Paenibacillus pabuli TaxID=1472 RepID=UPI0032424CFE
MTEETKSAIDILSDHIVKMNIYGEVARVYWINNNNDLVYRSVMRPPDYYETTEDLIENNVKAYIGFQYIKDSWQAVEHYAWHHIEEAILAGSVPYQVK